MNKLYRCSNYYHTYILSHMYAITYVRYYICNLVVNKFTTYCAFVSDNARILQDAYRE